MPNVRVTIVKNLDITENIDASRKDKKIRLKTLQIVLETETLVSITLFPITATITVMTRTSLKEQKDSPKLFTHTVIHVEKQTTPQKNAIL